jgi:hypothetical protein
VYNFVSNIKKRTYIEGAEENIEALGDWRKLHDKELHNLYSSTNIIRMIKRGVMNW